MKRWLVLLSAACLVGCAATPPLAPAPDDLLHDAAFAAPAQPVSGAEVFAVSPAMRAHLRNGVSPALRRRDTAERGLLEALYTRGDLKLEYDSERTRTAAEAFDARAGNCLSLAIMTGAFAKEMGMSVRYQTVDIASTWGRSGDLVLHNGHVNVSLKQVRSEAVVHGNDWITIDFIPVPETYRATTRVIDEKRVIAMYMNNRAAEELAAGQEAGAYWWARGAVLQDPAYADAYNTLGVVYRRRGELAWAEAAMRRTLALDGVNTHALGNLAALLQRQGRVGEAAVLSARLERLQPERPFENFERGMLALRRGEFRLARDLLEKEVKATNDNHEVHLGLALAYQQLGEPGKAARHLALARENSTTRSLQALYAAKLALLKSAIH